MKKILVTGGTVFVSKFVADYFRYDNDVYVLNRNTRKQLEGVTLIEADRHNLGDILKAYNFDVIIDVCAYNSKDINDLLDAVNEVSDYIMISSSAVYPETNLQPFKESQNIGVNSIWGDYGTNKIEAEKALLKRRPQSYILRPPYLYGKMQNVYREPFVFECALADRKFCVPKNGEMKLQFFNVEDLCRVIEKIIEIHPENHIFNVGNEDLVDINTFVSLCYKVACKELSTVNIFDHDNQRDYFSFYDYEYALDVSLQRELISETKSLETGLRESFEWYINHKDDVIRKNYIDFIDKNFS